MAALSSQRSVAEESPHTKTAHGDVAKNDEPKSRIAARRSKTSGWSRTIKRVERVFFDDGAISAAASNPSTISRGTSRGSNRRTLRRFFRISVNVIIDKNRKFFVHLPI